jgi:hypothetical protein
MDIPSAIRIPICIEQGSVFNFLHEVQGVGRQSKNRYFVVMNRNPKTDTVLLLVTPTTQIEKKRSFVRLAGISNETIVEVTPAECQMLSHNSAFNCNDLIEVKLSDLVAKIENNGSDHFSKIPELIMKKLIYGVKESPMVSEDHKKLL